MTPSRWVVLSWWMLGASFVLMLVNDVFFALGFITDSVNLLVTLNLSYVALIVGAASTIVAAKANQKVREDEDEA